ncbi:PREDICTED: UDP-glycosyltransferase 72E3 isoform X3 [Camelina sativa]|uniref:Glycosyltransferase n=1 Tax=Camelina sativa TaxID=90675 RepID=A0ABM0W381_CAMSA|nr:PREDICTED: UDP-glycosyltransferase 72E3 isoform X1 [Camelina sativa]XP_019094642.1 PREDICTED: UDP-glycosyltransferase 72E3 isoform X2 [Camelina sativa]XP_019094646.1 PREDICTED: UDP-glycosyltransferase 72E3 isoform X3 [Camelina sativa]
MHITKPHAAMFSSPGMGHVMPVIELAKRLSANHGFHVTVFVLETDAASAQSKFLNSTGVDIVALPSPNISGLVDPEDHVVTKIGVIMREAVPALRSKIAAMHQKPTALIIDLFGTDALCLGAELNMLTYVFIASNARYLGVSIYYPTLDKDTKEDHTVQRNPLPVPGCEPVRFKDTLDAYLVPDEPVYRDLVRHCLAYPKADGILVNTWEEMEPKSLKSLQDPKLLGRVARAPVYPVGPLSRSVQSSKNEHPVFDWLNEQPDESVLYISFGSGGSLTANQLTELAWGLEQSQQRFVWVVRPPVDGSSCSEYFSANGGGTKDNTPEYLPEGFVTRTCDRGFVIPSWAPQAEVLAHRAVGGFLTHCGWSSTLESVVGGVPMIAWPLFAEQNMNAALLSDELGIAVRVDDTEEAISRSKIEVLVRMVMAEKEGEEMRMKVKKLRDTAEMSSSIDGGGSAHKSLCRVTKECQQFLERIGDLARGA